MGAESPRVPTSGRPQRLAFTPDGRRLAVEILPAEWRDGKASVTIWDVERKKELRVIPDTQVGPGELAFSADGAILAVPSTMNVGVWDVATGKKIVLDRAYLQYAAFRADGSSLEGISASGEVTSWDLATRRKTHAFGTGIQPSGALAMAPDGRTLAANGGPHVLHLWESQDSRDRFDPGDAHTGQINGFLFTADGKHVLSASDDRTVRLWDLSDGRLLRTFRHQGQVDAMQVSTDGR